MDTAYALDAMDHEPSLDELLRGVGRDALQRALHGLTDIPLRVTTATGERLLSAGEMPDDRPVHRAPLRLELETIGYVESVAAPERVQAAAKLLELVLVSSNRYRLASALHLHTVQLDYSALKAKHEALQESEARYRALNADLERRVTEQVDALDSARRQFYQVEKLASLGQLAGGMAHEINNPIGFIHSNLTTGLDYSEALTRFREAFRSATDVDGLRREWERVDLDFAVDDLPNLLRESLDGANRVVKIVAALRDFSRIDQGDLSEVDVNAIARSAAGVVAASVAGHAEIRLALQPLPIIWGHAANLGQLLLNVLTNAAQACARNRSGRIDVETSVVDDGIVISVRDNGCGIPEDVLPKVCDPFFTTKEVGQGTGLGLTVCNDIARAHGGQLVIDSTVGTGTVVTVYLPAGELTLEAREPAAN
jgi:signal transduction histidine kinase